MRGTVIGHVFILKESLGLKLVTSTFFAGACGGAVTVYKVADCAHVSQELHSAPGPGRGHWMCFDVFESLSMVFESLLVQFVSVRRYQGRKLVLKSSLASGGGGGPA